jgi:hypothetical protein
MIEKEFIPYELALELKQLQFDETCFGWFRNTEFTISFNDLIRKERGEEIKIIAAPTYSQAFRWFRENHGLNSFVYHYGEDGILDIIYFAYNINDNLYASDFRTYEEAELACLKKLIEIANDKQ